MNDILFARNPRNMFKLNLERYGQGPSLHDIDTYCSFGDQQISRCFEIPIGVGYYGAALWNDKHLTSRTHCSVPEVR